LEETEEKEIYKSYLNNQKEATSNLGELLREGMFNLQTQSSFDGKKESQEIEEQTEEGTSEDGSSGERQVEEVEIL
jgi:hypothetical protein